MSVKGRATAVVLVVLLTGIMVLVFIRWPRNHTSTLVQHTPPTENAGPPSSVVPPSVPRIIVRDPVGDLRRTILSGQYGQMSAAELLDKSLKTLDPSRVEMRLALLLRKEESLPLIRHQLRTVQDDDLRYELLMLVQGQLRWRETVPEIVALLNDAACSERVRGRAATAAALFQVHEAVPTIRNLLTNSQDAQARQFAAMALGLLRDEESTGLIEPMLRDESPYVRVCGAMVLGRVGSNRGLDTALALSRHAKFDVRSRAAEALSYIGTPDALARLREMGKTDMSSTVRSESSEYLGRAQLETLDKEAALDRLKDMLEPGRENPPRWAFVYLAEHFGPDAVHLLQQLAESPDPLQHAAVVALLGRRYDVVTIPHVERQRP